MNGKKEILLFRRSFKSSGPPAVPRFQAGAGHFSLQTQTKMNDPMTWDEFRTEIFGVMEEQRAKLALFRLQEIYWFVNDCATVFKKPGSPDADEALDAIRDNGTFLLVTDSFSKFKALFPVDKKRPESNEGHRPPVRGRPPQYQTQESPAPESSTATDSRRGSGRPFPDGKTGKPNG